MSYSESVVHYFTQPSYAGTLDVRKTDVGYARIQSNETGRTVELFIQLNAEECIIDARFKAQGCVATVAVMAYVADFLHEKTVTQALLCKATQIMQHLALPKNKHHCALMAEEAIKVALGSR